MIRRSLFDKSLHSFLHALSVIQRVKDSPLQSNSLSHCQVFALFYWLLSSEQGRKRLVSYFLGYFNNFGVEISSWVNFTDQTHLIGPLGRDELWSKDVSIGIHLSSNPCKPEFIELYLWVPPIPGMRPSLSSGRPNLASSEQKTTSVRSAISHPPPRATPLTPEMIGFLAL